MYRSSLDNHKKIVHQTVQKIPDQFSVLTNERLAPHLAHRLSIQQFEDVQRKPLTPAYSLDADLVILDRDLTMGDFDQEVEKVKASGYETVLVKDGFVILANEKRFKPDGKWTKAFAVGMFETVAEWRAQDKRR